MNRTHFVLLSLLLPLSAVMQAAEFVPVFEEPFEKELKPGWSWLRESPEKWKIADGGLEILMEPEHADNAKNVLWRKAPDRADGVWAVEVTITSKSEPTNQYEQTGIYWMQNGKLVFKFVKERIDGKVYVFPGKKPMDAKTVQLRLVVDGDKVVAQYRPDAQGEFLTAFEGPLPKPDGDQVGVQCWHGPTDTEHWIRFDDFKVLKQQ